jgi:hypothetical protein
MSGTACRHGFPVAMQHGWTDGAGERWTCLDGTTTNHGRHIYTRRPSMWRRFLRGIGWGQR